MNDRKRNSLDSANVHALVAESLRVNNVQTSVDEDALGSAEEKGRKRKKHKMMRRNSGAELPPMATAPKHVHGSDWKDMIHIADIGGKKRANSNASTVGALTRHASSKSGNWIEAKLKKRECTQFIPMSRYANKCGCGLSESQHSEAAKNTAAGDEPTSPKFLIVPGREDGDTTDDAQSDSPNSSHRSAKKWSIKEHTATSPTDTYGTIVFEVSSGHQTKAQYARLAFDTEPRDVYHLLSKVWKLPAPKLVITIHGGLTNFDLQPKLARIFRNGILKSARTTDAWIITSGLDSGVVKHVASALEDLSNLHKTSVRVIAIGIAPWGMLKRRRQFIGKDIVVNYSNNQFNQSRYVELNDRHSYFLFSDNGTAGRYGAEIILRKQLETFLVQSEKPGKSGKSNFSVPLVCVVLEGGAFTIKVVHDYVTTIPRIPVVVCDGSGRAADLLAFTHHTISDDGRLSDSINNQLMHLVQNVFGYDAKNAERTVKQLVACAKEKTLLTVFRLGESQRQDVDHAILTALLKGQGLSPAEQLQLALAWNRADIARDEIFTQGTEWKTKDLHNAMIDALCYDRTEFVHLLMDNGVSMHKFLTYARLEYIYNTDKGPTNSLRSTLGVSEKRRVRLTEVGRAMEDLMGNAYKSNYTKDDFKAKYYVFANRRNLDFNGKIETVSERQKSENLKDDNREHSMKIDLLNTARNSIISIFGGKSRNLDSGDEESTHEEESLDFTFRYPFSELLLWAVLTRRQNMALLMWRHGEEALAKALIASRLCSSMALKAAQSTLEMDLSIEFCKYKDQFENIALEMLQYCTSHNRDMTLRLLTYELTNWGNETCLSLAALNNNRKFLAHPSCQLLLSDLWLGGLAIRAHPNFKVLGCLAAPFMIFTLGFKSKEQLKLQPRTAAEHLAEMHDSDPSDSESDYFSDTDEFDTDQDDDKWKKKKHHNHGGHRETTNSIHELMASALGTRIMGNHHPRGNSIVIPPNLTTNRKRTRTMSITKKNRIKKKESPAVIQIEEESEQAVANRVRKRMKTSRNNTSAHYLSEPESQNTPGASEEFEGGRGANRQQTILVATQRPISWKRKIKEFYSAPITTYWLWFGAFIVFLCANTYDLLIKTPKMPSWIEWYVFIYILVWSIEIIRKVVCLIMVDRKKPALRKAQVFFFGFRNGVLSLALLSYIIGFLVRLHPSSKMTGRVILIVNSVLWALKLIDFLSVQPKLGPYINMAGEMIPGMIPIVVMVFVTLYGFGLIRQSITFPYEDWNWLLVRNIFFQPYFMLYGEVYAEKIDTCGDAIWNAHEEHNVPISQLNISELNETCVPGYFISPIFMTIFMLITNVLLMNTMVACCTYVFDRSIKITQEIFLFERYRHVMEYESTPCIPPPFTIIYHIYWIFKWLRIRNKFFKRQNLLDASLKLFLTPEQVEQLHSFEEECVEEMRKAKDLLLQSSNDERIYRTAERSEQILNRITAFGEVENLLQQEVKDLELRLRYIEGKHKEEMDYMRQMNGKLERMLILLAGGGANHQDFGDGGTSERQIGLPQLNIQPPSIPSSRRSSNQYIKRNSLPRVEKKRNSTESKLSSNDMHRIDKVLAAVDSNAETSSGPSAKKKDPASGHHPATPTFAFDLLESSEYPPHNDRSEDDTIEERMDELEPLPMTRNRGMRGSRRHALYTTIADGIVDDERSYYVNQPSTSNAINTEFISTDVELHDESE